MTSPEAYSSIKSKEKSFKTWLAAAIHQGELPPTDIGLDADTTDALWDIAQAHPNPKQSLIDRAKTCFNAMET